MNIKSKFIKRVSLLLALSFITSNLAFKPIKTMAANATNTPYTVDHSNYDKPNSHQEQSILADVYKDTPGYQPSDRNIPKGWSFYETELFPKNFVDGTDYQYSRYNGSPTAKSYMDNAHYWIDTSNVEGNDYYDNWRFQNISSKPNKYNYGPLIYYQPVTILNDTCNVEYKIDTNTFDQGANNGTTAYNKMPDYSTLNAGSEYVADYHISGVTAYPVAVAPTADFYFNSGASSASVQSGDTLKVIDGKGSESNTTYSDSTTKFWSTYYDTSGNIVKHNNSSSLPQSYTYNNAIITHAGWSVTDSSGQNVNNMFNAASGLKNPSKEGACSEMDLTISDSVPEGTYTVHHKVIDNWGSTSQEQTKTFTVTRKKPTPQNYNLTIHYRDTANPTGSDLVMPDPTSSTGMYSPSAPNGYTLTGSYRISPTGRDYSYSSGSIDLSPLTQNEEIYVMCKAILPPPTPIGGDYTLNIHYVDEDNNDSVISSETRGYTSDQVSTNDMIQMLGDKAVAVWFMPTSAPNNYELDTSKFPDPMNGYHILWNVDSQYAGYNGRSTTNVAELKVPCKIGGGNVDPTPPPVITTGTVIKRYFINYTEEQTADREYLYNVDAGYHTYFNDKSYDGYTCINSSTTVNVTAGGLAYADFYFKKNSAPPTAYIYGPDTAHQGSQFTVIGSGYDPQGESLTYYWTTSDGQKITGTQGTLKMGDKPITVTLYVTDTEGLSSPVVNKTINPKNNPPTVTLNLPETIVLGDDLNVNAAASDPDGDTLKYTWNTPDGMTGTVKDNGGTVQFMNKEDVGKKKTFTVTVDDGFGGTATAAASTTVVAPKPTVSISQNGTLKENRKVALSETSSGGSKSFPIDEAKTQWSFYDSNNNPINVTNTADSGIVESLDSTIGTSSMNVLFTKPGIYKVQCEVTNTEGDIAVDTKTIVVAPDELPIADFDTPQIVLRDPNNHNLATINVKDKSYSTDNDAITKRVWFYSFDSNNNGSFDDETFYVYSNGSWSKYGSYADVKALAGDSKALDSINSGNLTNIQITPQNFNNGTHVGTYRIEEVVQESFGQDTIQSLVTSKDCKVGTTY
ncbi:Ig-like domain-containing protein [Clostridium neuense]|uniref:Ig-like domain-containing protein n=1 Tax=Clostridium neuense TaxID=1728934 RepID=A0ABW8TJ40_9CLOT